jgi:hypothetical protein
LSLRDYFRGPLTTHELINLIVCLPPGCALDRAIRGEAAGWTLTDHLLARLNNITHQANASKRVPESQLINPPAEKRQAPKAPPRRRADSPKQLGAADLDALFTGGG